MTWLKIFPRVVLTLVALVLCLGSASAQEETPTVVMEARGGSGVVLYGEPVRRVYAATINGWRTVDNRRLILYTSPSRPYLVTLKREARGLRFDPVIGLKLRDRSIDARFDSIYVDGYPYAIERIEKLTKDVADALLARESEDSNER